jgi:hypothetical protein
VSWAIRITYGSATANYWRTYLFRDDLSFRRVYTLCADESLRVQPDGKVTADHNLILKFTGTRLAS